MRAPYVRLKALRCPLPFTSYRGLQYWLCIACVQPSIQGRAMAVYIYVCYNKFSCCVQDDVSYPGKAFAVGLTLEALSAHTVDESGKEAFVTQNPLKLLRKVWITRCAILPKNHAYSLHASFCCTLRIRQIFLSTKAHAPMRHQR